MKNLEVEDSEQIHAAFLVYMDLSEGEFVRIFDLSWDSDHLWLVVFSNPDSCF